MHAWHRFPVWGAGVPDEVCISTDGSGQEQGGWAFAVWALWHGRWYRYGWDGGAVHKTPWLLPSSSPAVDLRWYFGELGALTSAALWLTAWWDCVQVATQTAPKRVTIAVDNTAALGVAAGRATAAHPQAQACRVVWQAVQSRMSPDFRHVPGHHGFLVNEIVDFLAGYGACHPVSASVGHTRLAPHIAHDLVAVGPCLWLLPYAKIVEGGLVWTSPPAPADAEFEVDTPACDSKPASNEEGTAQAPRSFKFVQANVQTMSDVEPSFFNRSGHGQRRIYLSKQLRDLGVHVAFLQECRSRAGRWASHGLLSWRGGHIKGCYGVEIWVDPNCADPPLQLDHWRICLSQPRLLVIRCLREDLPLTLISAHAPHAERPATEIRAFWQLLQEQLRVVRRDGPVIVGIDANADFLAEDEQGALIGPLLANRLLRQGDDFLFQTVVEAGLLAAGTWPEIHHGPTWTWQHTSGKRQRLDHILFSQDARIVSHSQCPEFDILTREARDHMPLICEATLSCHPSRRSTSLHRYSADRAVEVGVEVWRHLHPATCLGPKQHMQEFLEVHNHAAASLPPRPPFVRRQPYLSDAAAAVLADLRDARAEVRRLRGYIERATQHAVLRAWRGVVARADHRLVIHMLRLQVQLHSADIRRLGAQAHALARRDKQCYFAQLLGEATAHWHETGRPLESTHRLAWASKTAKQKRDVRAASGYDIDLALQAQFQDQEAGQTVSAVQLSLRFSAWEATPKPPCRAAAPTLLDLEALCRLQKPRKAPGPDAVRNEIWRVQPESAGRWLWPLCCCISLGRREPLHFKDSSVCALHKKGPAYLPANFRSIAMLNGVAKLWHSHVRGQDVLRQYFPTQLGGRRGIDTSIALGIFRCACDLATGSERSWAAFFVDIQAAYYETSRSLLFDGPGSDPTLEALQMPAHVHALIADGALKGLGIPPEHVALLQDCVECSFWTFTGQSQQVMATRGSRPGDGLADVLFGAVFAVILSCLEAHCQSRGLVHQSMSDALGVPDKPLQIAWADDLSLVVDFQSARAALALLPQLATLILQVIEAFRFRVNLGEGKTEALVHLCGAGATAAKRCLLDDTRGIVVADGRAIRVVAEYKYLGVPQRASDNGRRDIEAAAGRGKGVWSQAASLIHSPALPWPLKLAWFQGRTLPAAFSSLSTTLATSARALGPLHGFYEQCLRQLASTWDDGHHASSETLKVCIHAPDVETAICTARVRLLCRILQQRSDFAYDILVAAWDRNCRWANLLGQAVRQVWPATALSPLRTGEPTLAAVARHSKQLLAACQRVSRHGTMQQALCRTWVLFGQGTQRLVIGQAAPQECPDCGVTLPSKHALAAHLHRMHGRVALCTQYTSGPVCLWCLCDFHNTARLRYHLLHSPICEHGLRCVVGPAYEYGTGSRRRGRTGHLRAPVQCVCGPLNASPAQRQAALEGRICTEAELAEELERLAPGPPFSSAARSLPVVPRPDRSDHQDHSTDLPTFSLLSQSAVTSHTQLTPGNVACPRHLAPPRDDTYALWGSFADFAQPDDWAVPSVFWQYPQPRRIWHVPPEWTTSLDLCVEIAKNAPWSPGMWRLTSPLRREAAAGSDGPRAFTFAEASSLRRLFFQRIVTFRLLLDQVASGAALWFPNPPRHSWLDLIRHTVQGVLVSSTIPVLGFGTLVSLSHLVPGFLASLRASGVEHSRVFRLAAPHLHCHSRPAMPAVDTGR